MKRLLYILLCLPFWLACTDEHIPASKHEVEEGKPVELRMSVALGEMNSASSRAFGDDITDYPSLWIVAFDKDGYLVEWAQATNLKRASGALDETEFSVILHATSEPRILHFIANYTDDSKNEKLELEYGHESNIIGSLSVSGDRDVYWHRKVYSGGINTEQNYIAANFRRIPLLRNFAKITVSESLDNFELTGFYVLNVPQSGTVAPYSNGAFVDYMAKDVNGVQTEEAKNYDALTSEGYIGTMPNNVGYSQDGSSSITWQTVSTGSTGSFFMYENTYREVAEKTTSILIKGKFGGSNTETYYRADLTVSDVATGLSTYYHILRNFHYNLNITSVIAAGKSNASDAITAPANNNLSGSVQVQNLSNISDGTAKLEVSYTDMVLVTTDQVTLKYRFISDIASGTNANNRIKIYTANDGAVIDSYSPTTTTGINVDSEGWSTITITPVGTLPASTKDQTITLYDVATKLRREVKYTLRPKLDMEVQCTPKVKNTPGSALVVDICIPNNLNENLFPLEFAIESNTTASSATLKQYISPDEGEVMAVSTGGSIVDGHIGEKSYQYIKELTYEQYQGLDVVDGKRVFPVKFVTNIAASASTVYVDNQYFNKGSDFFVNALPALVDTEYYGTGKDVFYMYEATANGTYTFDITNAKAGDKNQIEVTLSDGDIYETILKTTTWSDNTSVEVGNDPETGTTTRNKLAMRAASTSGTDLTSSTDLHVYLLETAAKSMSESSLGTFTNGKLTTSYNAVITANSLLTNTPIYFAYETAEYVYVASASAESLANGTAVLAFVQYDKPLEMSAELTGEQYYGIGKTVTLTLTTNKPGTYNVSFTEVGINGSTAATITVAQGFTTGTAIYTTKSWSGAISATVTYAENETLPVTGDSRNVLKITATIANNNSNAENYITNDDNGNTEIRIRSANNDNYGTTTYGTITARALRNGTAEITYDGLTATPDVYFRFTYWYYDRGYKQGTGSANITPENATGTGILTFN